MKLQYSETILNTLSAHIAIIDGDGFIIETNRAWRSFARINQLGMRPDMLKVNYLKICDAATDETSRSARLAAEGIRSVINGERDEFVMDYPCHSPDEKRWFLMRAVRVADSDPLKVVISHENITSLKLAEQEIAEREKELEERKDRLEEANIALRALLNRRDEDLKEMENNFFRNIKNVVLPYLDDLKHAVGTDNGDRLIQLIESELNNLASPFLKNIGNMESVLTRAEVKVASLIKQGKTTKEISDLLNLSVSTVNFHRRNLREKLNIKNTATSLYSHLISMER